MQQTISMNAFKYVIKVSEETDIFGTLIPAMMLQPIVENAVKYGINHQLNNNLIEVSVFENEDYVLCTIADSGSDQKTAKTKDYISKGKKISIEQLQLLHKKSKHKPYITEQEKFDGGLTVTFGFPKK